MRLGGRQVVGFGIGRTIEEVTAELEKSNPCAACHHDAYSKLRTFGAVVAGMGIGAGLYGLYARPMYTRK
jgi:hypothetical protein